MQFENVTQIEGRGRPQGSPPLIRSTPAPTMITTEEDNTFIVRAGADEGMGGDPCGRPRSLICMTFPSTIIATYPLYVALQAEQGFAEYKCAERLILVCKLQKDTPARAYI